ncbi:MAG: alpha/beta fold hydrolase [Deltaproteobacteria bacterium]|nr:alpha/beta fold hydrolase [Deltaproteobacteria bacterium]
MPQLLVHGTAVRYRHQPGPAPLSPAILLLHMAGSSSLAWSPVVRRLAGAAEVLAPDLPGHGQSAGEPPASISEMADFALAFLDALRIARVTVAGHSMGGAIALALALRQPARVQALLLASTAARLPVAPAIFAAIDRDFENLGGWFEQLAAGTASAPPVGAEPIFPQTSQLGVRRDFEACAAFDVEDRLAGIACPATVLVGRDDRLTPPRWSERLADGLAVSRLQVVERCGHLLPRERPELVAAAARDLVAPPSGVAGIQ